MRNIVCATSINNGFINYLCIECIVKCLFNYEALSSARIADIGTECCKCGRSEPAPYVEENDELRLILTGNHADPIVVEKVGLESIKTIIPRTVAAIKKKVIG